MSLNLLCTVRRRTITLAFQRFAQRRLRCESVTYVCIKMLYFMTVVGLGYLVLFKM